VFCFITENWIKEFYCVAMVSNNGDRMGQKLTIAKMHMSFSLSFEAIYHA
jgi:hypothetical protein